MAKQPWEIPDPPQIGDAENNITFRAVGAALSTWEWFEGHLALSFSYLVGSGYGNVAAIRAYGSVESFRGRANMIEEAAEVYFKHIRDEELQSSINKLVKKARDLCARRNDVAHGIVNPYSVFEHDKSVFKGYLLMPAYYATRKRKLPETAPLTDITPSFIYSSVEIDHFRKQFDDLAKDGFPLACFFLIGVLYPRFRVSSFAQTLRTITLLAYSSPSAPSVLPVNPERNLGYLRYSIV